MSKRLFEIRHRYNNKILFSGEYETLRHCVLAAIESGVDLSCADLSGADLSYADLRNADLRYAILRAANLCGADLRGADILWDALYTARRIGPTEPDDTMVICPVCTSQFRAIPLDVQRQLAFLGELLALAKRMLAAWEGSGPGIVLDDIRALIAKAEGRSDE